MLLPAVKFECGIDCIPKISAWQWFKYDLVRNVGNENSPACVVERMLTHRLLLLSRIAFANPVNLSLSTL